MISELLHIGRCVRNLIWITLVRLLVTVVSRVGVRYCGRYRFRLSTPSSFTHSNSSSCFFEILSLFSSLVPHHIGRQRCDFSFGVKTCCDSFIPEEISLPRTEE